MITVEANNITLLSRNRNSFIPDFIARHDISLDGSGDDRQPADEASEVIEDAPLMRRRLDDGVFLCDLILKHNLGDDVGSAVIQTAYYSKANSSIPNFYPQYLFDTQAKLQQHTDMPAVQSALNTTFIPSLYTIYIIPSKLAYAQYSGSSDQPYSAEQDYMPLAVRADEILYSQQQRYEVNAQMVTSDMIYPMLYAAEQRYAPVSELKIGEESALYISPAEQPNVLVQRETPEIYHKRLPEQQTEVKPYLPHEFTPQSTHSSEILPQNVANYRIESQSERVFSTKTDAMQKAVAVEQPLERLIIIPLEQTVQLFTPKADTASLDYALTLDNSLSIEFTVSKPEEKSSSKSKTIYKAIDAQPESQAIETDSDYAAVKPILLTLSRPAQQSRNLSQNKDLEFKLKVRPEAIRIPQLPDKFYRQEETVPSKQCSDTSNCFTAILDWMDGKGTSGLSEARPESLSQCYAEQIKNIQKAREYIKLRKEGYLCGGSLRALFHHNDPTFRLRDYVRNGEVQEGFKLAERLDVRLTVDDMKQHVIESYNTKTGEKVEYRLGGDTLYAYLNRHMKGTIIWKDFSFIDTDNGKERTGVYVDEKTGEMKACLYLETIAQYHTEAKRLLGDKDEHGMKLNGIIILINGEEPGQGKTSLFDYKIRSGDVIEIVYKNDKGVYERKTVKRAA